MKKVGIVGLGIMGGAFARNLIKAGWSVAGFDPSAAARERFVDLGGTPAGSAREVANLAECIFLSLPNVAALRHVVAGDQGISACTSAPKIVIEASTLPLDAKTEARDVLRSAGHTLLDCPVSGTGAQAEQGDLVVFGSGEKGAWEACLPVMQAMSRQQVYAGDFGAGIKLKIIANHLVTIHNVAAGEAMAFASKLGLDRQLVYDALFDSAASSRMLQVRGPQMVSGSYAPPTATVRTHVKDLSIISEVGAGVAMPLPLFAAASQHYFAALSMGLGNLDTASVCQVAEMIAGSARE